MRIKVKDLGDGLFKLKVEKTCPCERVSNGEMDNIARDVTRRHFGATPQPRAQRQQSTNPWLRRCEEPVTPYGRAPRQPQRPCAPQKPQLNEVCRNGKPVHGFDAHIDVPQRKDFRSYCDWADAMNKFYRCEAAVKACDWPSVEEPKWAPKAQPAFRPAQLPAWQNPCSCQCWDDDDEDIFDGLEDEDDFWFEF